jgi:tetratricopeptide (TPR) repeat protein
VKVLTVLQQRHNVRRMLLSVVYVFLVAVRCFSAEERIENARKFIREWNYDRALTEIISLRHNKNTEIQYLLGYCYLKKNEFDEAALYFEQSLASDSTFRDSILALYNGLAQNALRIDEPERALYLYQECARLIPEYDQANNLFLVGDLHFEKENYPAAVTAYTRAFEIDSTSKRAKRTMPQLITALRESNRLALALRLAQKEYTKLKTAANLWQLSSVQHAIGVTLFEQGSIDSAKVYFDHIIASQEPKSLLDDAYFYVGEIYFLKGNLPQALEAYKKVLRLNPYEKGDVVKKAKARIEEIKELS